MKQQFIISVALLHFFVSTCYASVIYVKPNGSGDGSSWDKAMGDVQSAIDIASRGDQVWVSEGRYTPNTEDLTDPRLACFQMKNFVAIYGGFTGTETRLNERDVQLNETILSGDLHGDDTPATATENLSNDPNRSDNCYHVFYHPEILQLDPNAVLDGFTITAGHANGIGISSHVYGGGMLNDACSPFVTRCVFRNNLAKDGGGMSNRLSGAPVITECTFSSNFALWGGGMENFGGSPTVSDCNFIGNCTDPYGGGGGMHNYQSDSKPTISDCTFIDNSAGSYGGGGMFSWYYSKPTVTGCDFINNTGGGMKMGGDNITVEDCAFINNEGGGLFTSGTNSSVNRCAFIGNFAYEGGGIYNQSVSMKINECLFAGNSAEVWGGGIDNWMYSSPTVSNCTFVGNSAGMFGGGISNRESCNPDIVNCTFFGNSSQTGGGGLFNLSGSHPKLTNCIVWENTAAEGNEIYNFVSSTISIRTCVIAGSGGSGTGWNSSLGLDNGGNLDVDPLFEDPNGADGVIGTSDDNLRLLPESPCMESGDNNYAVGPTDLDQAPRIMDGDRNGVATVDMGAYECRAILFVNAVVSGGNGNGSSWADAFDNLQDALSAAVADNHIWVAEGVYKPDIEVGGTGPVHRCFQMKNQVEIYGGFPNNNENATWIDRDPNLHETILSGDVLGNDSQGLNASQLIEDPSRSDNCYHVFYHPEGLNLNSTAVLDGFTITAGHAYGSYYEYDQIRGGGMYNYKNSPTINHCTFTSNSAHSSGGGMVNMYNITELNNCEFVMNAVGNTDAMYSSGGGLINSYSSATLKDCRFHRNFSGSDAGGMANNQSSVTINRCLFTENSSEHYGGGMHNTYSDDSTLTNCIFADNNSDLGGGMSNRNVNDGLRISSCEFRGNSRGGMHNYISSNPVVKDCTFTGNIGVGMTNDNDSCPTVEFCLFQRNQDSGMINQAQSRPSVSGCTFTENSAIRGGGGMQNTWYSSAKVIDCIFHSNSAMFGGGMDNDKSNPLVLNCIFESNSVSYDGGGMRNDRFSDPNVVGCSFISNSAVYTGGGMCNRDNSSPRISSSLFRMNTADNGGGIHNWGTCCPTVSNCTFSGNSAVNGAGFFSDNQSCPTVNSCILWDQIKPHVDEIYNVNTSMPVFAYCDIAGSGNGWKAEWGIDGGGNFDSDPQFIDPNGLDGMAGTVDDDLHLQPWSPCIEAGDPMADLSGQVDIDGESRIRYSVVDVGSDEVFWIAGDLESDEDIDLGDFTLLASQWLQSCDQADLWCAHADINHNASVDLADLTWMIEHWLKGVELR